MKRMNPLEAPLVTVFFARTGVKMSKEMDDVQLAKKMLELGQKPDTTCTSARTFISSFLVRLSFQSCIGMEQIGQCKASLGPKRAICLAVGPEHFQKMPRDAQSISKQVLLRYFNKVQNPYKLRHSRHIQIIQDPNPSCTFYITCF